ncbi:LOW QUALITY PROTEIN: hypothetical protein CVT26_008293 [Gymnopilus dilepis]|uniref:Uncharacterized protein n=1 Tax=Gymnopilus dilepis TaxID=231916 RepID=A0A409WXD1_9AGAR|nr:LOW QUALITY PROTEIN: hypothetical protein CVT26_008293 [Gymnopilus dilepis]
MYIPYSDPASAHSTRRQRAKLVRLPSYDVQLCRELTWVVNHMLTSQGVFLMFCPMASGDRVLDPLHRCFPGRSGPSPPPGIEFSTGSHSPFSRPSTRSLAFVLQHHVVSSSIVTTPTLLMFSSFRASSFYNPILITTLDLLLSCDMQLQVVHIPGSQNTVADALSRFHNSLALHYCPSLFISTFEPPLLQPPRPAWCLDRLRHERAIALGFALEPASISSYSSAFHSCKLAFCTSHGFSVEPTPDTLSFLRSLHFQLEGLYPEVRTVHKHPLVVKTLTGCTKLRALPTIGKRPLTRAEVGEVFAHLKASCSKLFRAILTTSFLGLLRLGECAARQGVTARRTQGRSPLNCNHLPVLVLLPPAPHKVIGFSKAIACSSIQHLLPTTLLKLLPHTCPPVMPLCL